MDRESYKTLSDVPFSGITFNMLLNVCGGVLCVFMYLACNRDVKWPFCKRCIESVCHTPLSFQNGLAYYSLERGVIICDFPFLQPPYLVGQFIFGKHFKLQDGLKSDISAVAFLQGHLCCILSVLGVSFLKDES